MGLQLKLHMYAGWQCFKELLVHFYATGSNYTNRVFILISIIGNVKVGQCIIITVCLFCRSSHAPTVQFNLYQYTPNPNSMP